MQKLSGRNQWLEVDNCRMFVADVGSSASLEVDLRELLEDCTCIFVQAIGARSFIRL